MSERSTTERWLLTASYSSVAVALLLILMKSGAWLYTGSASLLGSLLDSVMDSFASIVSMLAVRYSLKPADEEHSFGHGKAESLAALMQAAFIMGSALLLLLYCVQRLLHPGEYTLEHTAVGVFVAGSAIVFTLGLVALQTHVVKITGSTAISADRLHYKSDLFLNISVIISLLAAQRGFAQVDVYMGIVIALIICHGSVHIGREAFQMLMDKALPADVNDRIKVIARSSAGVLGVHDLRTRRSGMNYIIQLHIEVSDDTSLVEAHGIADDVEARLHAEFPSADVIIHQDPQSIAARERRALAPGG